MIDRKKGLLLVVAGAALWGVSGSVAHYLFKVQGFSHQWLVTFRLLVSGILLLAYSGLVKRESVFSVFKDKRDLLQVVFFGVIGMLGVQYTYFAAINYANAATATILQFQAPVLVILFMSLYERKVPGKLQLGAILMTVLGTFLVVTNGRVDSLAISERALFWGVLSALTAAFYTIQPRGLLARFSSTLIVGWGMLIGGVAVSLFYKPWDFQGIWDLTSFMAVSFVIVFGTLIAFFSYLESLRYIHPAEASMLSSFEPLSAAALSFLWLKVDLGLVQCLGMGLIIGTVFLLSGDRKVDEEALGYAE